MKSVEVGDKTAESSHRLDPVKIIEIAESLSQRIAKKWPESQLAALAAGLAQLARDTEQRVLQARRPILAIRIASFVTAGLILLGLGNVLWYLLRRVHLTLVVGSGELLEAADSGINVVALLAAGMWLLITLEARIRSKKVLESIQELREFIHVIDVTQLYHTPKMYHENGASPDIPQSFDHNYLIFCGQMLAVISNLAALYTRGEGNESVLRAASDVQMLAIAKTEKLYSKADMVRLSEGSPAN